MSVTMPVTSRLTDQGTGIRTLTLVSPEEMIEDLKRHSQRLIQLEVDRSRLDRDFPNVEQQTLGVINYLTDKLVGQGFDYDEVSREWGWEYVQSETRRRVKEEVQP